MNAFANIVEDAPDKPVNAGWYEDPCDDEPRSEFDRQRSFLKELHQSAPAVVAIAIPNGSHDTDWTRIRKWKEGAVAGAPDLWIGWNHGQLWAEFKSGKGIIKPAQIDMLNRLHRLGFRCGVYRQPQTLIRHLRDAGAPFLWTERVGL